MSAAPTLFPSTWNCTLATPTLSEAVALTVTVLLTVELFDGEVIEMVGGVVSLLAFTVTFTPALVVAFPAASFATAVSVWLPCETEVVFHEKLYGELVSAEPTFAPSTWNCTLATPTLSEAVALTVTVPLTVALFAGEVIDTVGGVVSLLLTVTFTPALVVLLPAESFATAVSVWLPFETDVLLHEKLYGEFVSAVPTFAPSTCNCTLATATLSEAVALTETVPLTVALFAGEVIETAGGVVSLLFTVTFTAALVVVPPEESFAIAVKVWLPFDTDVVLQEKLYGELVSAAPTFAPSTCNCTLDMPPLSEAVAFTVTTPLTVALFDGEVIETVGGVLLVLLLTVTFTPALVVAFPAESFATAVKVWLPFETEALLHEKVYGEFASAAPTFAPSTCNCTLATATLSEAVAFTVTTPLTVALFEGEVIETVGGVVSLLLTVTFTPALVAEFPPVSVARAVSVWLVFETEVVFQEKL